GEEEQGGPVGPERSPPAQGRAAAGRGGGGGAPGRHARVPEAGAVRCEEDLEGGVYLALPGRRGPRGLPAVHGHREGAHGPGQDSVQAPPGRVRLSRGSQVAGARHQPHPRELRDLQRQGCTDIAERAPTGARLDRPPGRSRTPLPRWAVGGGGEPP
ncbi:unnamed protein product, partial [Ectocarpus sp. 12 AP-2014]